MGAIGADLAQLGGMWCILGWIWGIWGPILGSGGVPFVTT